MAAADYYGLEEAAKLLGMSAEELNRKAQRREVRAFSDKGTWRFAKKDVDALRAQMSDHIMDDELDSMSSDATNVRKGGPGDHESGVQVRVSDDADPDASHVDMFSNTVDSGAYGMQSDASSIGSTSDIGLDEDSSRTNYELAGLDELDKSDVGAGGLDLGQTVEIPTPSDRAGAGKASNIDFKFDDDIDSGIRLDSAAEIDLSSIEEGGSGSGSNINLGGTLESGSSAFDLESAAKKPAADSDFDLNEEAIEKSSGSDFELSLESGEESGIFDIEDVDEVPGFKMGDSDDEIPAAAAPAKPAKPTKPAKPAAETDSDSDLGGSVESDFELEIEEEDSGSEVVSIDEDETEEDEEPAVAVGDDDYEDESDFDEEDEIGVIGRVPAAAAAEAQWPGWVLAPLIINALLLPICGIMIFELMRNAWSFEQPYQLVATMIESFAGMAKSIFG